MNLLRPAYKHTTHFPNGARDATIKNLTVSQPVAHINQSFDPDPTRSLEIRCRCAVVTPVNSADIGWSPGRGRSEVGKGRRRSCALRELVARSQFGTRFINRQVGVASA